MVTENKHKIMRTTFITIVFILFALTFWPFLTELLLAALFAFAFHDITQKMLARKIKQIYASLIVSLGVLIFIATPLVFFTLKTISAIKDYAKEGVHNTPLYHVVEKLLQDITVYSTSIANSLDIDTLKLPNLTELLSRYSGEIGSIATTGLSKVPQFGLSIFIFFIGLFYFLNESQKIKAQFLKFDLLSETEINKIVGILKSSSYMTLAISLLIAAMQARRATARHIAPLGC